MTKTLNITSTTYPKVFKTIPDIDLTRLSNHGSISSFNSTMIVSTDSINCTATVQQIEFEPTTQLVDSQFNQLNQRVQPDFNNDFYLT